MSFSDQFVAAQRATHILSHLSSEQKNTLLFSMANALRENYKSIIAENKKDILLAEKNDAGAMIDRLLLDKERIFAIAADIENVAGLDDEVGKIVSKTTRPNGLQLQRVRCPIGVVGIIYESRPNVTVDAAVIALKSGNTVVLKGGKEAQHSNRILAHIMQDVLEQEVSCADAIQLLDTTNRTATAELLQARGLIDVVIPRGGKGLISFVVENAKIPVIETGASVVHTYVDSEVDMEQALAIVINEKTRRVSVCNALDTLLVHEAIAQEFLAKLSQKLLVSFQKKSFPLVKIHAEETVLRQMNSYPDMAKVVLKKTDYEMEWLDYAMNICIVNNIDEALEHIQTYSLGHSESICSKNEKNIQRFLSEVDSACVYANASTCFSDGAQFGLGAEIGISTQKMHVRGPFALEGLTSTKWIIRGTGQTRR